MGLNIFDEVIVTKEAKEVTLKIYPSDYDKFVSIVKDINSNLKEGEVKEEEVFSKMLNHALNSVTKNANAVTKRGRKPSLSTTKNKSSNSPAIQ
jgi:hypothetical protein